MAGQAIEVTAQCLLLGISPKVIVEEDLLDMLHQISVCHLMVDLPCHPTATNKIPCHLMVDLPCHPITIRVDTMPVEDLPCLRTVIMRAGTMPEGTTPVADLP